jgi:hypothetical protein
MRLSSSRSTAILHRPQQDFLLWDKAGTRPSLDQQFADRKDLIDAISGQQLITHTHASAGTYRGSDGLIKTAVTNLVLQSEDFSTTWSTTRASVSANSIAAPNGTLTADTLTADGTTLQHNVAQSASFSATGDKTYSVFAKAGTNNFMQMLVGGNVNVYANFDLSTGTIGDVGTQSTADIASLGDGWYRCQLTTSQTNPTSVVIGLVAASNSIRAESNSLSTSIYLWGAQLEQSSTVGEYIPTTSTINSAPRFDHDPVTGECLGLLVEEQRTNLLLWSEEFDNAAWPPSNSSISPDQTNSPSASANADLLVESLDVNSTAHSISQLITLAPSTTYTFSIFLKSLGRNAYIRLDRTGNSGDNIIVSLDLTAGTITSATAGGIATLAGSSIVNFGDGWYRCSLSGDLGANTDGRVRVFMLDGTSVNYTGNGTSGIYIWGAQLE